MTLKHTFGIGFALALALAGCGSTVPSGTQSVTMNAIGTSGQSGNATLIDTGNGATSVTLNAQGGTDSGAQPAHIHTGTCGSNGPIYKALTNVQGGVSVSSVDVPLTGLTGGKYYINIHKSSDTSVIQACGQIQ